MDRRTRDLERELSSSPNNIQLQHTLIAAKVRAGELLPLALERLVRGRPVQPWQWAPASYVLLEAERIGRETEWREGRVEIEWSTGEVTRDYVGVRAFGQQGIRAVAGWVPILDHPVSRLAPGDAERIGCCPDTCYPQMVLLAFRRAVRAGSQRGRWLHARQPSPSRSPQGIGRILDVRLIKSVRIMQKRGRGWKNNPDEHMRRTERAALAHGDPQAEASHLAQRLRTGQVSEPVVQLLAELGHPAAAAVLGVTEPFPPDAQRGSTDLEARRIALVAGEAGDEAMVRLALENAQFFVDRYWGPPVCPQCGKAMHMVDMQTGGAVGPECDQAAWVCNDCRHGWLRSVAPAEHEAVYRALDLAHSVVNNLDLDDWDASYSVPPYQGSQVHAQVRFMTEFLSMDGARWEPAFFVTGPHAAVTTTRYALLALLASPSVLSPHQLRMNDLVASLKQVSKAKRADLPAWRAQVSSRLAAALL